MDAKPERSPMRAQWPDSKKIQCKDCFNRDRTEIEVNGKVLKVGISKAFCNAYPPPPDSNGKPIDILFQNAKCKFYAKET